MACKDMKVKTETNSKKIEELKEVVLKLQSRLESMEEYLKEFKEEYENMEIEFEPIEEFLFIAKDKETLIASTSDLPETFLSSIGLSLKMNEWERDEEKIYTTYSSLDELYKGCKDKEIDAFGGVVNLE